MAMELTELLMGARSRYAKIWDQTHETLRLIEEQDLPCFLLSLSAELANDEKPADSRESAGKFLKDAVDAHKPENVQRWLSLDGEVKTRIKSCLINTLSSLEVGATHMASRVIAKIARIECPEKHLPDLIGSLLSNVVDDQVPSHVKQATFNTLYFFGREVSPDVVVDGEDAKKILTALIQGISDEESSSDARVSAILALGESVSFVRKAAADFSDSIMNAVCGATRSQDMKIREVSFLCLMSISSVYYEKLGPYIHDLLIVTSEAVDHDESAVAAVAMEFFSWLCNQEIHILKDGHDCCGGDNTTCFYFVKQALPALVPILLKAFLKQDETAAAGGDCLSMIARMVGDDVFPLVTPFIEQYITSSSWRGREAAISALATILEGPYDVQLTPIADADFKSMLTALVEDHKLYARGICVLTLGRIFEFLNSGRISEENCQRIVSALFDDAYNPRQKVLVTEGSIECQST
ncbi:Importin subunit beta-1 [Linum grandiflorum]